MNKYNEGYFNLKNNAILELKPNVFRTYCYMISKDYVGSGIWHSQQTMANEMKLSVRSIQRHIKQLKELGYISVKRRGFNMTNIYHMLKNIVEKVKEKKEELRSNFKKSFSKTTNKKKSKFNNFIGRNYSKEEWDRLENKLLGWE